MARGMTGRENLDLSYLADPASEMSRGEGISGRYRAGRPRGHDSERGEPRIAGSRGYGDHRATRGGDVSDSGSDLADSTDDDDDDDDDSLAGESARPRFGRTRRQRGAVGYDYGSPDGHSLAGESAAAARRFGGSSRRRRRRRHRGTRGGSPDSSSSSLSSSDDDDDDNDSSAQAPARPRPAGTPRAHRARALPHSRRTIASRTMHHLSDSDSDSSPSDESTDDEASAPRRGGGAASGHRHGARSSRPVAMYPGGDAGSVDFLDSEAGFGGRDTGRSQYGSRRAPGPYGRYAGGGGV